ncbi:nucleotidyl transferase AbiEii/AbiGii toxin family protein [Nisaea sediminum]|uniref:nucleotidyl transferase AbiEii/AbiGii toxin family protein n=1 Tax=Nisaea sediminum TaxID=2775867 RepID=UPI001866A8D4|nr:nucleotidyl transferase AbiEii/AbiGii toxin family protein [Nisaea sediminum]
MIPRDYITEWRSEAPWVQDAQVEQDLVISRALVEIFSHPHLKEALAFRGGTALYKLFLKPAARYSEDIDLVQVTAGPIGETMDALREVLDPWLGEPRRKQGEGRVTLTYRFESEDRPPLPLRLKVEINSREHFAHFGFIEVPFSTKSRWFEGEASIKTYSLNELLGTKIRALYQRRKGRDLFDLAIALQQPDAEPAQMVEAFQAYMASDGGQISRAQFEQNLITKLSNAAFSTDIGPLLSQQADEWNIAAGAELVMREVIALLPGEPWQGVEQDD